jgi:LytR cell envelope-related transcriptional attenuator
VTIPGRGDLVPRRHQTRVWRWFVTALVLVLLGAGGYFAYLGLTGGSTTNDSAAKPSPCRTPTVTALVAASKVHLVVRNATERTGLAAGVAAQLRQRGFHITEVGNTQAIGTGVAKVRYGHGRRLEAQAVAVQIRGAKLVKAKVPEVELDIGPKFRALLTPAGVRAAQAHLMATEAAALAPTPNPTCS